jgi:hypothetical protein
MSNVEIATKLEPNVRIPIGTMVITFTIFKSCLS